MRYCRVCDEVYNEEVEGFNNTTCSLPCYEWLKGIEELKRK